MATRIRDEWKRVAHGTTLILIDPLHLEKNRDTYAMVVNTETDPTDTAELYRDGSATIE